MKAAVTAMPGEAPRYGDFPEPEATDGCTVVDILASALTNLDVIVAEGRHYFSPQLHPFVVGKEAVARDPAGQRLFLNVNALVFPYGSMAEQGLALTDRGLPVPNGVSDVLAAALGNAGLAGWLSLSWRARLQAGETVLILGATGASGLIAVAAAKLLGAGRVVAAGRNPAALETARLLGANATVQLVGAVDLESAFREAADGGVDVVIDFLNGPPAEAALRVLGVGGRMVQIGSPLAPGIVLGAQIARKNSLDVLGFAYYHAPLAEQAAAYWQLCEHAVADRVKIVFSCQPLSTIADAWVRQKAGGAGRIVLTP